MALRALRSLQLLQPRYARLYTTPTPPVSSPEPTTTENTLSDSSPTVTTSTCPTNTILTGVNYLKGQAPVLALPDAEYPDWLWTLLEKREPTAEESAPGQIGEKRRLRKENRDKIKARTTMK